MAMLKNIIKKITKVNKRQKKGYKEINIKGRTFVKATIKGGHRQKATSDMLVSADTVIIPYGEVTIEKIRNRKIVSYQIKDINNIKNLLKYCSVEEQEYWKNGELDFFIEQKNMGMNVHMYEGKLIMFY